VARPARADGGTGGAVAADLRHAPVAPAVGDAGQHVEHPHRNDIGQAMHRKLEADQHVRRLRGDPAPPRRRRVAVEDRRRRFPVKVRARRGLDQRQRESGRIVHPSLSVAAAPESSNQRKTPMR
jgi:hypothetical protein